MIVTIVVWRFLPKELNMTASKAHVEISHQDYVKNGENNGRKAEKISMCKVILNLHAFFGFLAYEFT